MRNTFTNALAQVRAAKKGLRIRLALEITGGVILLAVAARNVETGQPWWLLTFSGLMVALWAVMASRTSRRLDAVKEDEDKLQTMSDAWDKAVTDLRDLGMPDELLDLLNGQRPTPPAPDDEPATVPAPAAEPEPKS